jgi:hypothetical protein
MGAKWGNILTKEIYQCSSCGGFCKKSGCERDQALTDLLRCEKGRDAIAKRAQALQDVNADLRAKLAERSAEQTHAAEVTSWIMFDSSLGKRVKLLNQDLPLGTKLYTASNIERQCKWPTCQNEEYQQALAEQIKQELVTGKPLVGLTDEEIGVIFRNQYGWAYTLTGDHANFARAVEAKLKERNHG